MPQRTARTRRDPRREATRIALIEKAEALIARYGIEGVSTRQIGAAIGSANNNVVAYHFGGKEELITAIYHHRLPAIETRRAELLEAAGLDAGLHALMRAAWLPLYEQVDDEGKHSYAAFLAGLARSGWAWTRYALHDYPVIEQVVERMRLQVPERLHPRFRDRLIVTAAMISNSLAVMDEANDGDALFEDMIVMAVAALLAESD
jgi:AcrR family transcriptional regulator